MSLRNEGIQNPVACTKEIRADAPLSTGLVVQGLWLQYYGLKVLSMGKNALLENEAVLARNLPRENDLPEPAGFLVAT